MKLHNSSVFQKSVRSLAAITCVQITFVCSYVIDVVHLVLLKCREDEQCAAVVDRLVEIRTVMAFPARLGHLIFCSSTDSGEDTSTGAEV